MFREVRINAVLNGFVVHVGCQTIVFQSAEELLKEFRAYLDDPDGVEARYRKNGKYGQLPAPGAHLEAPQTEQVEAALGIPWAGMNPPQTVQYRCVPAPGGAIGASQQQGDLYVRSR